MIEKSQKSAPADVKSAKTFSRRNVLKTATAVGAFTAVGPAIVKNALSASGELNILMWSDYLPEPFLADFENETGIKINYTGIGSNEEIINKMKANKGQGFDIVSPTNNQGLEWGPLELLQPWDLSRVPLDAVNPAMSAIGNKDWDFGGKGSHWLPHIWGTEGIAWRTDKWAPAGAAPSYGDVWSEENAGKTMGRPHSMMLCAGLYMETIGELNPGDMWKAYESEETMRPIWEKVTDWCIARKNNIKLLWNDADTQKNGLLNEGVIVGQTWDGPPMALKTAGDPIMYQAPVEGAMAWVDGMSMPIGAKNIDQIYEFIKFSYNPKNAGKAIDSHGYNSPVLGADQFAGDAYKKNFADAYPGDSLSNLNPWPPQAPWYAAIRTEYVNKFKSS
ncbi:MAG: spermidine/putrescine ABC transporter substrate-binding protein [Sneathiella sp.]|uniref:substrate-binding domain-containing protein n=1 Tax=Sneathiella sp. TaxID=1964365 RepID=UPI000C59AD3C|nr:substrate-binding domain-containing protein [Sneathiella sp.]MAZ02040.1 spermidine/putrescine ABC transporter substrate-binding protein [Sneathiella sp.]